MTDIEGRLRDTLHTDAGLVPVPGDLAARAKVRAGRIRRNRRLAAAAGVTMAVLATVLAVPLLRHQPAPPPDRAATVGIVGADPRVLHFDIDEKAIGGTDGGVQTLDGRELVRIYGQRTLAPLAFFIASADPAKVDDKKALNWVDLFRGDTPGKAEPLTVNGRPGTIVAMSRPGTDRLNWRVRWEPRPGMFMRVDAQVADRSRALAIAAAVRPDRTVPCLVPFRAAYVPAGYRLNGCQSVAGGSLSWARDGDGRTFYVTGAKADPKFQGFVPNITVDGMPARWDGGSTGRLLVADQHGMRTTLEGLSQPEALRVVRGLTVATNWDQPETWPR